MPCDAPSAPHDITYAEFENLYSTLAQSVRRRVLPIVRNRADAEDVTQQAFAQAWSTLHQFDPGRGEIGAWLTCIARARAVDLMRMGRRRGRLLSSKTGVELSPCSMEVEIDAQTWQDRVDEVIARLPEISRRALRLAYSDGLSHRQIAELLGRPLGTIKTVIRTALQSIRSALRDDAARRRTRTTPAAGGLAPAVERPFTTGPADELTPVPAGTQVPVVARLDGLHVVCVDDDERTRELLEWVLRRAGAWCTTCSSAAEARSVLDVVWPDVLVADITMPGEDGHALMHGVRERAGGRGLRVRALAFTACGREDERARALLAGFSAHLSKPVHPAAVVSAVSRLAAQA